MSEPTKAGREQFEAWAKTNPVPSDATPHIFAWITWKAAYQAGRESMREDLEWADEFIVEPEWFPNEGDRIAWREHRRALAALPLAPGKESE